MFIGRELVALLLAGVTAGSAPDSAASPWVALAAADVDAFCRDIREVHPGMVDPLSPAFATQVDRACQVAAGRSRHVASFLDWMETMQALVTSFRDGHTGISFTVLPAQLRWPGFLIDGQGAVNEDIAVIGIPTEGNLVGNLTLARDEYAATWAAEVLEQLRRR